MNAEQPQQPKIVVTKNGPYVITGGVPLMRQVIGTNAAGESWEWKEGEAFEAKETYALCRCGHSGHAPYCDGTHAKIHFDGTETAPEKTYTELMTVIDGPALALEDARPFCAAARFCDAVKDVWDSMEETGDPAVRERVVGQVGRCPSGRLVIRDKATGEAIEPKFTPSIGVTEDPAEGCSGPLWVRGGVTVQSQGGRTYETRNRVTLCRCGRSANKPYCDGTHIEASYRDGIAG